MKKNHFSTIAKLGIPLVIGSILQIFMNTMDMFFISRLGTDFAAASAMGTSIAGVIFVFSMLISAGAIALVARKQGEKDEEGIKIYSGTSIFLAGTIGIIVSIVTVILARPIIMIYDPDPQILEIIYDYVSILFAFNFVVFLNTTLRSIVQATGDTRNPLFIFGTANLINIVLDYFLIVGLGLGIRGAAIATVASQTIACVLMIRLVLIHIYKGNIRDFITTLKVKWQYCHAVLKIGVWACIQSVARPITGLIMMRIIYFAGSEIGTAAFGIGLTIVNYFFIILTGIGGAVTILVGQKLGEGVPEEAKHIVNEGIKLSFVNFAIFFIPFVFLPQLLFVPFKQSPEVVDIGVRYLRIVYTSFVVLGFTFMYRGAFSGAGDTYPPMMAALIANVFCKVVMAYAAVHWWLLGLNGVWWAIALSVWIEFVLITLFYRKRDLYIV